MADIVLHQVSLSMVGVYHPDTIYLQIEHILHTFSHLKLTWIIPDEHKSIGTYLFKNFQKEF